MKNSIKAVLLSFICPGLGQFHNKQAKKGWLFILSLFIASVVFALGGLFIIYGIAQGNRREVIGGVFSFLLGLFSLMIIGVLSMFDAYSNPLADEGTS